MTQPKPYPNVLAQLHAIDISYLDFEMDFESYSEFLGAEETTDWMKAWTGQNDACGDDLSVFGQDGSGGYTAFWRVEPNLDILDQPVVFLGSEGEICVAAKNFSDYLWLLANSIPASRVESDPEGLDESAAEHPVFSPFADQHATTTRRKPSEILMDVSQKNADFTSWINAMCKFDEED